MIEKLKLPPQYQTGHAHIDDQHSYLLGIIVACATVIKNEKKHTPQKLDSEARELIEELLQYTKTHFSYEEKIMEKTHFPEIEHHKKIHHDFLQKTLEIQHAFAHKKEHKYEVIQELLVFLKGWYFEHVVAEDKKIAMHVKEVEAHKEI
jgi:hemerythrin-like metal-binding protein